MRNSQLHLVLEETVCPLITGGDQSFLDNVDSGHAQDDLETTADYEDVAPVFMGYIQVVSYEFGNNGKVVPHSVLDHSRLCEIMRDAGENLVEFVVYSVLPGKFAMPDIMGIGIQIQPKYREILHVTVKYVSV